MSGQAVADSDAGRALLSRRVVSRFVLTVSCFLVLGLFITVVLLISTSDVTSLFVGNVSVFYGARIALALDEAMAAYFITFSFFAMMRNRMEFGQLAASEVVQNVPLIRSQ